MYKMYILSVLLKNMKKKNVILVDKDDKISEGKCVFYLKTFILFCI